VIGLGACRLKRHLGIISEADTDFLPQEAFAPGLRRTGLGRSMIYQMEADQRSPKRIKIGTRAVGWLEREVHAWLIGRIEISRDQSPV
jgi:prophage regulatory protein